MVSPRDVTALLGEWRAETACEWKVKGPKVKGCSEERRRGAVLLHPCPIEQSGMGSRGSNELLGGRLRLLHRLIYKRGIVSMERPY